MANQPFIDVEIEILKVWFERGGEELSDRMYQARRGSKIIGTSGNYEKLCQELRMSGRAKRFVKAPAARSATWGERLFGKTGAERRKR